MKFRLHLITVCIIALSTVNQAKITHQLKRTPAIQPGTAYQNQMVPTGSQNRNLMVMPGMGGMNPMQMQQMGGMGGMGGMNPMQQMGRMPSMPGMGGMNPMQMQQMGGMPGMGGMGGMQKNWAWGQNPNNMNKRKSNVNHHMR